MRDPLESAAETLRESARICDDSADGDFFLDLHRLVSVIESNPLLARCWVELQGEARKWSSGFLVA